MSAFLSQPAPKNSPRESRAHSLPDPSCARRTVEVLRILFPEKIASQNRVRIVFAYPYFPFWKALCFAQRHASARMCEISPFGSRKMFAQMIE